MSACVFSATNAATVSVVMLGFIPPITAMLPCFKQSVASLIEVGISLQLKFPSLFESSCATILEAEMATLSWVSMFNPNCLAVFMRSLAKVPPPTTATTLCPCTFSVFKISANLLMASGLSGAATTDPPIRITRFNGGFLRVVVM